MGELATLIIGGALGFLSSLLANAVTGPLLSLASRHWLISFLSAIPFTSDKVLRGRWTVGWSVRSGGYPPLNEGVTTIKSFLGTVAFSAESEGYGARRVYLYVGQARGGVVSGRWYDPDGSEAYHGMFQVKLNGTLQSMSGKWIGWAVDGTVKEGDLRLERSSGGRGLRE